MHRWAKPSLGILKGVQVAFVDHSSKSRLGWQPLIVSTVSPLPSLRLYIYGSNCCKCLQCPWPLRQSFPERMVLAMQPLNLPPDTCPSFECNGSLALFKIEQRMTLWKPTGNSRLYEREDPAWVSNRSTERAFAMAMSATRQQILFAKIAPKHLQFRNCGSTHVPVGQIWWCLADLLPSLGSDNRVA